MAEGTEELDVEEIETDEPSPEDVLGAEAFEDVPPSKEETPPDAGTPEDVVETKDAEETPDDPKPEDAAAGDDPPVPPVDESAETTVPFKVNYGGQEFEIQVTQAQADALDAQNKTASQFSHLQGKYQELKTQSDRAVAMAQTASPAAAPPAEDAPAFNPEEFVKRMQPAVSDSVERGAISREFSEMYPTEAANYAWAGMQLNAITEALAPIVKRNVESVLDDQRNEVTTKIHDGMTGMASEHPELYGDLTDKKARDGFFNHLLELNADVDMLMADMPGTLSKFWGSYQGPKLIEAARLATEKAKAEQAEKRLLSGGGGGGGGGGRETTPKTGALDDINEILGGER